MGDFDPVEFEAYADTVIQYTFEGWKELLRIWNAFEKEQIRNEPADHQANLQLFDQMYDHALALGALQQVDPVDHVESRIRLARAIHDQAAFERTRRGS